LFFTPSEPYKEKFLRTIFIPLGTPPPDQGWFTAHLNQYFTFHKNLWKNTH
jgi:hypothetical protein